MQITIRAAIAAKQAIEALSQMTFPGTTAMAIRRLMREMDAIYRDYDAERLKLLALYDQKDAQGKPVVVEGHHQFESDEQKAAFDTALAELRETLVEVRQTLTFDLDNIEITPAILFALGDLLVDEKTDEVALPAENPQGAS